MNSKFTQKAQNAINAALDTARSFGHTYVGSEHLLIGLCAERDSASSRMLSARGGSHEKIREATVAISGKGSPNAKVGASDMTPCVKKIIEESGNFSLQFGQSYIGTEHLLLALLEEQESVAARVLERCGVPIAELRGDVSLFLGGNIDRNKTQRLTRNDERRISALSGHGRDLNAMAKLSRLDPVIGRENEISRVIQILSRRSKNNPCLIGEPGVGKTAIVEGLAQRIVSKNVPENLIDKVIITLDISSMVAGAKYRGEFEERLKNVMSEVARRPEIILFIDELHTIIGAGAAEGAVDAANIIKPALARGEMRVIGATTIDEYRRHIEKDAALERRFLPVLVNETTEKETENIIFGLKDRLEAHHRLKISDAAVKAAVTLSKRYINDRFLPDKAIDVIDETAARLAVLRSTEPSAVRSAEEKLGKVVHDKEEAIASQDFERAASLRDRERELREEYEKSRGEWEKSGDISNVTVTAEDVAETIEANTGVPVSRIDGDEKSSLLNLEEKLREKIVGQENAIKSVSEAIRRGRSGLSDPNRPTGSFIFLGPTGVGKTELSKALAEAVFGDKNAFIRLDMSEYSERHSVSKLIGSPPGYVGYGEGGLLTEKVRRRPYSLVLFDEIEKAHPDIYNMLLQILDDGRLTDSQGRRVDFRNTVVIMTSNLGVKVGRSLGFSSDSAQSEKEFISDELKNVFRPEFINRVDEIVVFDKLSDEGVRKIVDEMLGELAERVKALGITLEFDKSVGDFIAKVGYDEKYGARPLRRAVTKHVSDVFSKKLLDGSVSSGDKVFASERDGEIIFETKP